MIKKITLLLFIILTPTLSYSYQCTMLMSNVDSAIMKIDENKYSSLIEAAKMLKEKGKEAHYNGDHLLPEDFKCSA